MRGKIPLINTIPLKKELTRRLEKIPRKMGNLNTPIKDPEAVVASWLKNSLQIGSCNCYHLNPLKAIWKMKELVTLQKSSEDPNLSAYLLSTIPLTYCPLNKIDWKMWKLSRPPSPFLFASPPRLKQIGGSVMQINSGIYQIAAGLKNNYHNTYWFLLLFIRAHRVVVHSLVFECCNMNICLRLKWDSSCCLKGSI